MQIKQNIQGSFGIKDRLCKGFTPCRKAVRLKTDRSFLPAVHLCCYKSGGNMRYCCGSEFTLVRYIYMYVCIYVVLSARSAVSFVVQFVCHRLWKL